MADTSILFFFCCEDNRGVVPPLVSYSRGGCKLSSWAVTLLAVSFPSVSQLIRIQDAALHPDMNP